ANAREQRRRKTRAGMVVLDADVELLRRAGPEPLERRVPETRAEERGDLARDAHDAEAVRAVGLKVEREDGLAEDLAEERADRQLRVEDVDPLVLVTEAELFSRQHHALALDPAHGFAAQRRALSAVAIDDRRAFVGIWDDRALGQIRRAGNDRLRSARAVVDGREEELVRVRMLGDLLDARRPDLVVPPRTLDALHLGARHVKLQSELVYRHRDIDVLAQPRHRHLDQQGMPLTRGGASSSAGPRATGRRP